MSARRIPASIAGSSVSGPAVALRLESRARLGRVVRESGVAVVAEYVDLP
jgi:hypothetical protein